jgi:glycosyltransferase involved in cell wall biosynthesis
MDKPLVSVYIPTYNRVQLLTRAVNSVLNQTYENIELIVVDDCSTDGTVQFLEKLTKKDSRIKYFQNEQNSGACVSRNKAIMEAKGEFITGLDDDDYFLSNRIEDFFKNWNFFLSKNSNMICLFSDVILKSNGFRNNKKVKKPKKVKQHDLLVANWIGNQIFTKTDSLKFVLFDEKLKMWQDLDCWYRLLSKDKIALNTKSYTCVVDMSHPHERITFKKIENVYKTFEYLKDKYKLNKQDSAIMQTHIYYYDPKKLNIFATYKLFVIHKKVKILKILLKRIMVKNIKKIIRKIKL